MEEPTSHPPKPVVADDLTLRDLGGALAAGWGDFVALPLFGLFFGAIFAVAGLALSYVLIEQREVSWLIPAAAGFPLLAPFTAVGLYEVSRRREASETIRWSHILGAIRGRGDEQILSMGVILFVAFSFWVIIAHLVFSIFVVEAGAGADGVEFLMTGAGMAMLAVGSVIGAVIALVFYAITVVSLPMLVDREVDFLTAIFSSLKAFRANLTVMLAWAVVIAVLLFVAMLPAFLGLFVVLPVLGHATWHLYRRLVS